MLFNSFEFIFMFLPLTFIVYFYLNHKRLTVASKGFLVFTSLVFYSWWNIIYLPLILSSMLFNYIIGNTLAQELKNKKRFSKKSILIFGIIANISLLAYFKYADFFIENLNFMTNSSIDLLNLALPLAISFFTFQQIAYLVDSYRSETKEYDFLNYAVFVTFFPQLIAGPIVHHKEMMPQFELPKNKILNYNNIAAGLFIFSIGLFKKVVIADTFAIWATAGFDTATTLNFFEAWGTSLSYTFQLYFDFSGYTDMAVGLALLFNIKLPVNFNSPYKATNIQDFWRRWHITLSRFLRDYIYIPLGGSRVSSFRIYSNLMTTFIIGGLWHGAGWTFIFWGFLHGIALVIHRIWSSLGFKLHIWLAWFITFNFINISWVFFRAKEWDDAIKVLSAMFSFSSIGISKELASFINYINPLSQYQKVSYIDFGSIVSIQTLQMIIVAFLVVLLSKNSQQIVENFKFKWYQAFFILFTLWCLHYMSLTSITSQFLYFNF
ncbi:MAG: MBOAT family protein [Campylobacterota bacterium]|nr:MBOAT family protein [Campylobacterota bacterium]